MKTFTRNAAVGCALLVLLAGCSDSKPEPAATNAAPRITGARKNMVAAIGLSSKRPTAAALATTIML